ncbi:hypothetical protein FB45DRAFT_898855 [Roridomyces roridus]|uniref:Mitochondrial splicing suppressor 51-like C-terminal domain-containing protein n=1 Tax=Roridomyces roridus TaxID=1738132 RepID=A0AAD7FZ36_9AGAR|nr:hypothetical protein FB45DRAFT_898855 [Roridomyces roridus]
MSQESITRLPPLPASMGLACYKCYKEEGVKVSKCTGCRRVAYCSPGPLVPLPSLQLDWKQHKLMCKALSSVEKEPLAASALLFALPDEATSDLNVLHKITEAHGSTVLSFCVRSLGRRETIPERNLIGWEPRCMGCTRTDQLIRMEAAKKGTQSTSTSEDVPGPHLTPCPRCDLSFCCSPAHWELAQSLHHSPCPDGHDGLTHCDMNREIRADIKFEQVMASAESGAPGGEFLWMPERIKKEWMSSAVGVPKERPMGPWVRAASESLTMPMTILYALEQLNEGDAWTKKHTLTVHVLGADTKEIKGGVVFEEILHRLPQVKTIKIVLCGPEMPGNSRVPRIVQMETCADCTAQGRKRVQELVSDTYHGYIQAQGTKFEAPDLAIAFNSGASQESTDAWRPTFKVLVERKIPSAFTAFNREEAEPEAALLEQAGATLHPGLGPSKNPWGCIKVVPEPNRVYGFYARNGWLAGGFR